MPHLIIESSDSLSSEVVAELHRTVGEQESVSIEAVKTRLFAPNISFAGKDLEQGHIAITLKLLSGRSQELKEKMAANLFEKASKLISNSQISVEITELGTYKK